MGQERSHGRFPSSWIARKGRWPRAIPQRLGMSWKDETFHCSTRVRVSSYYVQHWITYILIRFQFTTLTALVERYIFRNLPQDTIDKQSPLTSTPLLTCAITLTKHYSLDTIKNPYFLDDLKGMKMLWLLSGMIQPPHHFTASDNKSSLQVFDSLFVDRWFFSTATGILPVNPEHTAQLPWP